MVGPAALALRGIVIVPKTAVKWFIPNSCTWFGKAQGYNSSAVSLASKVFKDHETAYVVASVSLAWVFTILLAAYEIGFNTTGTNLETTVAIAYGVAAAAGLTLLTVGTFEVVMVIARRREQRLLEQARREREEVEKRWKAWYDSLPDEVKKTQPPPPNSD